MGIIEEFILQLIASFLGTISFAILFEAPRRYYLVCGVIGSLGWAVYLLASYNHLSPPVATFIAAFLLILLSREAAYWLGAPVTIFLICGIFCLVPGIGIYNFAFHFMTGESAETIKIGIQVIKVGIAISLGISAGYELPARCFFSYRRQQE